MRKAQEAKEETEKIKKQVLEQAKRLNDAGQFEEAIQIVQQLKGIIPNDLEISMFDLEVQLNKVNVG